MEIQLIRLIKVDVALFHGTYTAPLFFGASHQGVVETPDLPGKCKGPYKIYGKCLPSIFDATPFSRRFREYRRPRFEISRTFRTGVAERFSPGKQLRFMRE